MYIRGETNEEKIKKNKHTGIHRHSVVICNNNTMLMFPSSLKISLIVCWRIPKGVCAFEWDSGGKETLCCSLVSLSFFARLRVFLLLVSLSICLSNNTRWFFTMSGLIFSSCVIGCQCHTKKKRESLSQLIDTQLYLVAVSKKTKLSFYAFLYVR